MLQPGETAVYGVILWLGQAAKVLSPDPFRPATALWGAAFLIVLGALLPGLLWRARRPAQPAR
ncbi:hypothetical protein [Deinococcus hohokamensis]|uniref:Uncharacterized protein n=1 Tax=Deinococcus hohokamensis TaxID=309883 RepID=A0ABV9IBA8_9DEIO